MPVSSTYDERLAVPPGMGQTWSQLTTMRSGIPQVQGTPQSAVYNGVGLDYDNGMYVPFWEQHNVIAVANTDVAPFTFTIRQNPCPTCGIETDRQYTVPAGQVMVIAGLLTDLFRLWSDNRLYVDFTGTPSGVIAVVNPA